MRSDWLITSTRMVAHDELPHHPLLGVRGFGLGRGVPDIRYCSAHGETPEEAPRNVSAALDDILADARERALALPPPTERPVLARAS